MLANRQMAVCLLFSLVMHAFGAGIPSWAVLCVAPDGHVAVEFGPIGCCTLGDSGTGMTPTAGASLVAVDSCCGPCADLPLGSSAIVAARGTGGSLYLQELPQLTAAPASTAVSVVRAYRVLVRAGECQARPLSATPAPTVLRC